MIDEKFKNLIYSISSRPGMYGVNKVQDVQLVIYGYHWASTDEQDSVGTFITEFRAFVNNHYQHNDNFDWAKLIYFYSGSDINSLKVFAELFDSYMNDKA